MATAVKKGSEICKKNCAEKDPKFSRKKEHPNKRPTKK